MFYYTLNEKLGSHVSTSPLTASNTSRAKLTWSLTLTWLLYNLQVWRYGRWFRKFTVRFRPIRKELKSSMYNNSRKLLCLFFIEKFCKKIVYSGIELICEFAKIWLIITKTCFDSFLLFLLVWLLRKSFWKAVWRVRVSFSSYILLDVLLCSIAEYFYELCHILASP